MNGRHPVVRVECQCKSAFGAMIDRRWRGAAPEGGHGCVAVLVDGGRKLSEPCDRTVL